MIFQQIPLKWYSWKQALQLYIACRESKNDRQYNVQKREDRRTKDDLQNTLQKANDWARIPQNTQVIRKGRQFRLQ